MTVRDYAKVVGAMTLALLITFGIYQGVESITKKHGLTGAPAYATTYGETSKAAYKAPAEIKVATNSKPTVGVPAEVSATAQLPVVVLGSKNMLVFNEVVTEESVAQFLVKATKMSNELSAADQIFMVINSPGGDVSAGMLLMDSLKAFPQKVNTLCIFCASMGFQFVQNLGDRLIIPSGVLMSHRAYGGMEGEFDGEFDVRYNAVKRQIEYMNVIAADRMKMKLEDYKSLIRDEYWVHGFESVNDRAADTLVLARCGKDISGTYDKRFYFMGIPIDVTFSNCPLITGPLDIKIGDGFNSTPQNRADAENFTKMLYGNPKHFYSEYIKTGKFKNLLRK